MVKSVIAGAVVIAIVMVVVIARVRSHHDRSQWDRAARHPSAAASPGAPRSVHLTSDGEVGTHAPPAPPRLHVAPGHVFGEAEPAEKPVAPHGRDVQRALERAAHRSRWPRRHPRRGRRRLIASAIVVAAAAVALAIWH